MNPRTGVQGRQRFDADERGEGDHRVRRSTRFARRRTHTRRLDRKTGYRAGERRLEERIKGSRELSRNGVRATARFETFLSR
jgi:hypothetical protein